MNSLSQRIRTFSSLKWALKPISPLTLAKLGYCCIGFDKVECSCCKFTFDFPYTIKAKSEKEEKILCERTLEKAQEGHEQDCIFIDSAQGIVDDTLAFTNEDRIFYVERHLLIHYEGIVSLLTQYPLLSYSQFVHYLNQSDFQLLWLKDLTIREEKNFDSASILALMGYRAKSPSILECCFCLKEVSLDFFEKTAQRVQKVYRDEEEQNDEEKIEAILKNKVFRFDPLVFHSQYCQWVASGEDGTWKGALAALKIKYDATKRGLSSLRKFKRIADELRVVRAGYKKSLEQSEQNQKEPNEEEKKEVQRREESINELEERMNKRLGQFREKLQRAKEAQSHKKISQISLLKKAVTKQYEKVFNK